MFDGPAGSATGAAGIAKLLAGVAEVTATGWVFMGLGSFVRGD